MLRVISATLSHSNIKMPEAGEELLGRIGALYLLIQGGFSQLASLSFSPSLLPQPTCFSDPLFPKLLFFKRTCPLPLASPSSDGCVFENTEKTGWGIKKQSFCVLGWRKKGITILFCFNSFIFHSYIIFSLFFNNIHSKHCLSFLLARKRSNRCWTRMHFINPFIQSAASMCRTLYRDQFSGLRGLQFGKGTGALCQRVHGKGELWVGIQRRTWRWHVGQQDGKVAVFHGRRMPLDERG